MQHMLLVWHACPTGLATAGRRLKGMTGKQSASFQGNICSLKAMSHCLQAANSVGKFTGNIDRTRASDLQRDDQTRL